ncbi:PREDICTED: pre-mRNA-splicing factor 38B-like [Branchiostoma belcheri]|uniref:Pre-mRNA-splicing factor 38B-like n=1 Tax=Branchiostoma belcheri TaxID=7741 RepID=A0A6P4YU90_BRABE|nr:PREDICTED: pre-mRNA-splicing factor 38B-like [Branchiostoma belcheri]
MEKEPRRHRQSRRCSVCRLPVKGHPGPCGPGKCQYERGKGASDSDVYFSRLKDTVRHLRKESKVDEIARRVWSESTSDESEDVLTPRPRSLPVKTADLSPRRVDGNQARHARAYRVAGDIKASKKESDSEQYTVRDLRASKKLVREVDQVLEGLLEPTSRARGKIAEKRGNHRSSSTSSCGSNSSASSEEDRPHRARSTRSRRSRQRRRHRKRSNSRDKRHRKRSNSRGKRHRKRSDSREKRHRKRSDSREKRHRKRSDSREKRHRKRSDNRETRHRKRSDNRGRSRAASSRKRGERSRKNRSSSDSSSSQSRSRDRRQKKAETDLSYLREQARRTKFAAFAEGTWSNLRTQLRTYLLFCTFYDITAFPATLDTLESFSQFLTEVELLS